MNAASQEEIHRAQVRTQDWGFWSYPTAVSFLTQGDLPVADPGPTQFGLWTAPAQHTLDGSASYDPDGAALAYRWSLLSNPPGSTATLSSATAVAPTFTADVEGTYIFQLTVNNGRADSLPATVSVISKDNSAPTTTGDINVRHPWRSPCVPNILLGDDRELGPYFGLYFEIASLPGYGFISEFADDGSMRRFLYDVGTVGSGHGARTLCYIPFSSTWTGSDSYTYEVWDMGYPSGCAKPGNYCIGPKLDAATFNIEIYEN